MCNVVCCLQAQASSAMTISPYAVPVCSGPHHMPLCTGTHVQMCSTQPTWSIPACSLPIPSCSIQHLPTCSLQSLPVQHVPLLPAPHHPPPPHPVAAAAHHVAAQPQPFVPTPPPVHVSSTQYTIVVIQQGLERYKFI